jgi:hypothetical protein
MANPASITVTDLSYDGNISAPAAASIDTDGTVPVAAGGKGTERLILIVANTDDAAVTVAVKAGDFLAAGLGDLSQSIAAGATRIFGPFESARYLQDDGNLNVSFAAASGSPACSVTAYRLP